MPPYLVGSQANDGEDVGLDQTYLSNKNEEGGKAEVQKVDTIGMEMKFSLRQRKIGNTWQKKKKLENINQLKLQ